MTQDKFEGLETQDFAALGGPKLVYVREVAVKDLEDELQDAKDSGVELAVDDDARLFAVHAADGSRIAVLDNREAAFVAARKHEMEPVSVH